MDDAFTLLRRAAGLLAEDAVAENGLAAGDVRTAIELQEWELALDVLIEIADVQPVSKTFWEMLSEAARQMTLASSGRRCEWRGWEAEHGTIRATLTLRGADEGGRESSFAGDGRLRPLWDIGNRTADGQRDLNIAGLWVDSAPRLGPGETAAVRLAPLRSERWRHVKAGDVITMHEVRAAVGTAEVIEVLPPRS